MRHRNRDNQPTAVFGTLINVDRLNNTVSGNPMFRLTLKTNGMTIVVTTKPDIGDCLPAVITTSHEGKLVRVFVDRLGEGSLLRHPQGGTMTQPNPIPLDLAQRVWNTYDNFGHTPVIDLQDALVEHLPEIAACHHREVDVAVIEHALADMPDFMNYRDRANHIAAALSDADNGGHWEEVTPGQIKVGDRIRVTNEHGDICEYTVTHVDTHGWVWGRSIGRGPVEPHVWHRWVLADPADPDAALLAIVDADTLARLREVAEVTAR